MPSKNRNSLEAVQWLYVERGHKEDGNKLLNIKGVPRKPKRREFKIKVKNLGDVRQKVGYQRGSHQGILSNRCHNKWQEDIERGIDSYP